MPRVVGIGQQASRGIKSGAIVDLEQAEISVLNAVHAAEQMAGETIDRVVVNLSGGYPASSTVGVEVSLNGHEVGESDLRRALAYGPQPQLQPQDDDRGRQMIHSIPTGYSIDGNRGTRHPPASFGDTARA